VLVRRGSIQWVACVKDAISTNQGVLPPSGLATKPGLAVILFTVSIHRVSSYSLKTAILEQSSLHPLYASESVCFVSKNPKCCHCAKANVQLAAQSIDLEERYFRPTKDSSHDRRMIDQIHCRLPPILRVARKLVQCWFCLPSVYQNTNTCCGCNLQLHFRTSRLSIFTDPPQSSHYQSPTSYAFQNGPLIFDVQAINNVDNAATITANAQNSHYLTHAARPEMPPRSPGEPHQPRVKDDRQRKVAKHNGAQRID
jgi:hypothetical protein